VCVTHAADRKKCASSRTADLAQPICEEGLTLAQAEELLRDLGVFAVVELSIRWRIAANSSGIGSVIVSANHDCTIGVRASTIAFRPGNAK
jgi:hypothetical protein